MKPIPRSHQLLKTVYYDQLEDFVEPEPPKTPNKPISDIIKDLHEEVMG